MSQGWHLVGSLFQLLALVLVNTEPHTIHDNHIVIIQMIEIIGSNLTELYHSIVVGIGNLPQGNGLIVEECDARGTYPGIVRLHHSREEHDGKQCQEHMLLLDFSNFLSHIYF